MRGKTARAAAQLRGVAAACGDEAARLSVRLSRGFVGSPNKQGERSRRGPAADRAVSFVASVRNHIDALVHPSARGDALTAARQLQPWVDPAALAEMMVGQTILIANAWLQGRIADAAMIDRMALAVLTELAGSAREETRARIETTIRRIAAGGADAYTAAI